MALGASAGRVSRQFLAEAASGRWLESWAAAGSPASSCASSAPSGSHRARVRLRATGRCPSRARDGRPARCPDGATTAVPPGSRRGTRPRLATSRGTLHRALGSAVGLGLQVALSIVLLCTAAGCSAASAGRHARVPGQRRRAGGRHLALPRHATGTSRSQAQYFERLLAALAARAESPVSVPRATLPPARIYGNVRFSIDGQGEPTDTQTTLVSAVDPADPPHPGHWRSAGTGISRPGRRRRPARLRSSAPPLARRYWRDADPIGHRIVVAGDPRRPRSSGSWMTPASLWRPTPAPNPSCTSLIARCRGPS